MVSGDMLVRLHSMVTEEVRVKLDMGLRFCSG